MSDLTTRRRRLLNSPWRITPVPGVARADTRLSLHINDPRGPNRRAEPPDPFNPSIDDELAAWARVLPHASRTGVLLSSGQTAIRISGNSDRANAVQYALIKRLGRTPFIHVDQHSTRLMLYRVSGKAKTRLAAVPEVEVLRDGAFFIYPETGDWVAGKDPIEFGPDNAPVIADEVLAAAIEEMLGLAPVGPVPTDTRTGVPLTPPRLVADSSGEWSAEDLAFVHAQIVGKTHVDLACPQCGPDRKAVYNQTRKVLRVWSRPFDLELGFFCARCGWAGKVASGFKGAAVPARLDRQSDAEGEPADRAKRTAWALRLWSTAQRPRGTLVETYLESRGLVLPSDVIANDVIRFHPSCPFRREDTGGTAHLPTMLALMRDAVTGEPRAVHRTALRADGSGKAEMPDGSNPKKMLGPVKGAAVRLVAHSAGESLGLAEGIETALALLCAGMRPVWACGSAGAIKTFPLLSGVEELLVFADADPAGQTDAQACARRWSAAGVPAKVILPPEGGQDWADVYRGAAR